MCRWQVVRCSLYFVFTDGWEFTFQSHSASRALHWRARMASFGQAAVKTLLFRIMTVAFQIILFQSPVSSASLVVSSFFDFIFCFVFGILDVDLQCCWKNRQRRFVFFPVTDPLRRDLTACWLQLGISIAEPRMYVTFLLYIRWSWAVYPPPPPFPNRARSVTGRANFHIRQLPVISALCHVFQTQPLHVSSVFTIQ